MREILEQQLARFEELERLMVDPDVLANPARLAAIAREHGSLAKSATKYRRFKQLNTLITEAKAMASGDDLELRQMAEMELADLKAEREALWTEILDTVAGGEDAQRSRCMLEIRAGTGGDEAALFARDLYEMYRHYCEAKGWKVEVMDMNSTELGGFKEVIIRRTRSAGRSTSCRAGRCRRIRIRGAQGGGGGERAMYLISESQGQPQSTWPGSKAANRPSGWPARTGRRS